ncbi:MAG: 23S rRNA (uracil(1939)-C(5))-methyltransferase RlmD [Planctomycetota bacterium]
MDTTHQSDPLHCPHGTDCGACALLGVSYAEQLRGKRNAVGKALGRYERLRGATLLPSIPSPITAGYRNRAKMTVGISRRGEVSVGYFRKGTREIVDAPDCRVLVPELLKTTRRLRGFLADTREIPRELRHLDLRCGSDPGRQHLTLVFRATVCPDFPTDKLRRACPAIDGISVNLNPSAGPQVLRGAIRPAWGQREIWVGCAGLRLRVSPGSFFQVNLALLPVIHERVGEFLARGSVLADLYAGVGTHGLALRKRFQRVFFVEGVRSAVGDLKATIRRHDIPETEVASTSVERALRRLRQQEPDAVILNPSRAGAHESVLEAVAATPAARIAYLSCDPTTLCRDLDLLERRGFRTRSVQPIDMMPQTGQVEALAPLRRAL